MAAIIIPVILQVQDSVWTTIICFLFLAVVLLLVFLCSSTPDYRKYKTEKKRRQMYSGYDEREIFKN